MHALIAQPVHLLRQLLHRQIRQAVQRAVVRRRRVRPERHDGVVVVARRLAVHVEGRLVDEPLAADGALRPGQPVQRDEFGFVMRYDHSGVLRRDVVDGVVQEVLQQAVVPLRLLLAALVYFLDLQAIVAVRLRVVRVPEAACVAWGKTFRWVINFPTNSLRTDFLRGRSEDKKLKFNAVQRCLIFIVFIFIFVFILFIF